MMRHPHNLNNKLITIDNYCLRSYFFSILWYNIDNNNTDNNNIHIDFSIFCQFCDQSTNYIHIHNILFDTLCFLII